MTWATTALHNFPGLVFTFTALLLWKDRKLRSRGGAILLTTLALSTNGFGIATLGTLFLWEIFDVFCHRRNKISESSTYLYLILLLLTSTGWILFRIGLGDLNLCATLDEVGIRNWIHFLTNFLGSCIHFTGTPWIFILAVIELALFAWFIKKNLPKKHPVLFFFICYLLLSALLTTFGRVDLGPQQGLASRYRIYSTLFLCSIYLGSIHLYWKHWSSRAWILPATVIIAVTFFMASTLVNINNLGKIRDRLAADELRWLNHEPVQEFTHPEHAARVLNEAQETGIFLCRESD